MRNFKKLIVFVLALSLMLSSFIISIYANEVNNEDNLNSNSNIGLFNDLPPKPGGNSN